ncbi:hypothetical protein [Actinomarinicola tropica]|uniref:Uncharacterized protein n=1 Tax=Actinomarinicola tropica TaxID=2789776 RepID=A0A5Q2RPE9_9ACTN|nr:hypothetical protein [Actinomarinicola tropica]QGG95085.1 hypothetical protein GH723_08185 [Actinomarinicola tropica]
MSDVDPGGWVQGPDGRWYPPDAVPPGLVRRGPGGAFVLDVPIDELGEAPGDAPPDVPGVTRRRRAADRATTDVDAPAPPPGPGHPSRRRRPPMLERVGGPIRPTPTIYFGRPPGTENRRAGIAALTGALSLVLAAWVPWAVRTPDHLAHRHVGWRDANGALGPGWTALVLGLVALGLAAAALRGRHETWLRWADAATGGAALLVLAVEGTRIVRAGGTAEDVSEGLATVSPSWGLLLLAVGGAALLVAAATHRTDPPAWRRP